MANRFRNTHREPDIDTASLMLTNIMEELRLQPSDVPLDVMTDTGNFHQDRYVHQKIIVICMLVIFTLLPLFFIAPKYTVTQLASQTASSEYRIDLKTNFPVRAVSATIGDYGFPIVEEAPHVYRIQPTLNGDMKIRVTLLNNQYRDVIVPVVNVDSETPHLVDGKSAVQNGDLYLYVTDEDSQVAYEGIYALGPDDTEKKILPDEWDESEGLVIFRDCPAVMNIYVPDTRGNVLQVVLSFR